MQAFFTQKEEGNLGLHVGDNALHVKKNRESLKKKLGVSKLVFMDQVHGNEVVIIQSGDENPTCDALLCNHTDIGLAVMAADCIPIVLYDLDKSVIGVAHAGRVGTALHVGQKTVEKMVEVFGSKVENIHITMGPCIQVCCYEVGKEATEGLEKCLHVKKDRYFLDLPSFNKEDFLHLGIKAEHIEVSPICTCCDEAYFSYRREGKTGRFCGVVTL